VHYNYRLLYDRLVQPEKTNSNWFLNRSELPCAIRTTMTNCSWISFRELLFQTLHKENSLLLSKNPLTPYLVASCGDVLRARLEPWALRTSAQEATYLADNLNLLSRPSPELRTTEMNFIFWGRLVLLLTSLAAWSINLQTDERGAQQKKNWKSIYKDLPESMSK